MKRNTFDLSHFKKMAEDQHSATLMHPEGHQIKISKKSLASHLKKQLEKLPMHADGGQIDEENMPPLHNPELEQERQSTMQMLKESRSREAEERNKQLDYATGLKSAGPKSINAYKGGKIRRYAEGTPDEPVQDDRIPATSDERPQGTGPLVIESDKASQYQNDPLNGPYARVATPQTDEEVLPSRPQNLAISAPAKGPTEVPPGLPPQDLIGRLGEAFKGQEQAALGTGQAEAAESQAVAKAYEEAANQMADLHAIVQSHTKNGLGDLDTAAKEMAKGEINPTAYWDNKTDLGKVSTAIGLLVGGLGGPNNAAIQFLNKQIENSIVSQRYNQQNRASVFNAYLDKFKAVEPALAATRAALHLKVGYDILAAANKSQDPVQIQRANMLFNQIKENEVKTMAPIYIQQGFMQYAQQHPNADPSILVRGLKQSGIISEEQEKGANAEIARAKETEALRQATYQSFTNLTNLAQRGIFSPARRDAEVNLLAGKIEVLSNHRYNTESSHALADAMLPRRFEGTDTTQYKPHLIDRFFDAERAAETYLPSLAPYGVSIPKGRVRSIMAPQVNVPGYPKRAK